MMPARGVSSVPVNTPVRTPVDRVGRHVKLPLTTRLHVVTKFRMTLFFLAGDLITSVFYLELRKHLHSNNAGLPWPLMG